MWREREDVEGISPNLGGLEETDAPARPAAKMCCATSAHPQPKVSECGDATMRCANTHRRQYDQGLGAAWALSPLSSVAGTVTRRWGTSAARQQPQGAAGPRPSDRPEHHSRHGRIGVNTRVHSQRATGSTAPPGANPFRLGRFRSQMVLVGVRGLWERSGGHQGPRRASCEQFVHTYGPGGMPVAPDAFGPLTILHKTLILPRNGPGGSLLRWRFWGPLTDSQ